jgi:uncharacterized membrane protein
MIEVKRYFTHPNRDFAKNPLVELLPHIAGETLRTLMSSTVAFDAADLDQPPEVRLMYPLRLMEFFLPFDHQLDFAQRLLYLIWASYKRRNPLRQSTAEDFYAMCDAIRLGEPTADPNASFINSPWCAVLLGTPGCGKSATVNALLGRLGPDLFWHSEHGAVYQLLSLRVEAPTKASGKSLAKEVFIKLRDEAKKVGMPMPYADGRIPDTRIDLEHAIGVLARKLNLGILVLDELQHLFRGTGAMDADTMAFLTGVVNGLGVPILFIGTWEAAGLLALEARLGRRSVSPASGSFGRLKKGEDWDEFLKALLRIQYTRRQVELTPGLSERIYFHTQGIQDVTVKLMAIAQMEAIADGSEELSLMLLERVAEEHLPLIGPACRMLRGGRREDDPVLWDVEPTNFDDYVRALNARLQLRAASKGKVAHHAMSSAFKVDAIAASVEATGAASEQTARTLAESAVADAPTKPVAEQVVSILEAAKVRGPKPSRSPRKQRETDESFDSLDDDDLRKIVYLAHRGGRSAEDALRERDLIWHPREEAELV